MSYSRTPKTQNSVYNAMLVAHIELLACKLRAFTTDDLWDAIAHVSEPPEPRVLGPAMLRAQQRKLIAPSNMVVTSRRKACHSRPIAIWLSVPLGGTIMDAAELIARSKRSAQIPLLPEGIVTL